MGKSVLIISDQHFPYEHPDLIPFLKAIKNKYKPDKVINIGDEIDYHSISFHSHHPDLMGPGDELKNAIQKMKAMYQLFPKMDLIESNHGSLVYRKAIHTGLPIKVFKSYNQILNAPKTWKWHKDLTLKLSNNTCVYFSHGRSADGLKLSQSLGMNTVQGHFHEKFEIRYWGNSKGLYWSMIIGSLINNDSLAFEYNKLNLKRPIIGCAIILNGIPKLLPMTLKPGGRWNGVVP